MGAPPQGFTDPAARAEIKDLKKAIAQLTERKTLPIPSPAARDPRLVELQILADLEVTSRQFPIVDQAPENMYGLDRYRFRELLLHLLFEGHLNGLSEMGSVPTHAHLRAIGAGGTDPVRDHLAELLMGDVRSVFDRNLLNAKISHKGRLRLWSLRDELLSLQRREPFGILRAREDWERDLDLAFIFMAASPVSVLFCDVDHFKQVNDRLGHGAGDEALRLCFQTIKDAVERVGEAYRYGGDEVAIILPSTDAAQAHVLAEEVRRRMEEKFYKAPQFASLEQKPTLSIGAATFRERLEPGLATAYADSLAYESKQGGRNRVTSGTYTTARATNT